METDLTILTPTETIVWVLVGILISLILPMSINVLRRATTGLESSRKPGLWKRIKIAWQQYGGNKYIITFMAAVFVAIAFVFLFDLKFYTPRDAGLAGFAWESLTNKLFGRLNRNTPV